MRRQPEDVLGDYWALLRVERWRQSWMMGRVVPDQVGMDTWAFEHCLERGKAYPDYLAMAAEKGGGSMDLEGRIKEVESRIVI